MNMNKQDSLRPVDVAVAMALAVRSVSRKATFSQLGELLGISQSTAHDALQRLESAGLVRPGTREPNRKALRDFVEYGARYAFPPSLGREVRGVPTAHSGPVLQAEFDSGDSIVWPYLEGTVRGRGLAPLYPKATSLPERAPDVYRALTLFDAVRVGGARERTAALVALDHAIG